MKPTTGRLDGKVAAIVGGASGFGLATARLFAAQGATVAVLGRRGDLAQEVGEQLGGSGWACDICDFDQLHNAVASVVGAHGSLDIGVNYAGFQQRLAFRDMTPHDVEPMVAVQFTAALYFIKATADALASSGGGSVISTSSLTAQNPSAGQAVYAGSKKGLEYATKIAAIEYGPDNVRVNCIAAHLIETPMTAEIFDRPLTIEAVRLQTPLGRFGTVDDIANAALFLASDEAGYISGQTLCVDGAASTQKLPGPADYELLAKARPDLA